MAYHVQVASTPAAQAQGLSGRPALPGDGGMLFTYNTTADRCFWMKDMRVPLDIVWIDGARRVESIEHNVQTASYPHKYCHHGQYVLELSAGQAVARSLQRGDILSF